MLKLITGALITRSEALPIYIQLLAGCIISIPLGFGARAYLKNSQGKKLSNLNGLLAIISVSLLGMILPFNSFGIIPVMSTFMISGMNLYLTLPLLVSNALFNLLAPFTEIGFRWNYEFGRVIFALVIGASSGVLLWKLNIDDSLFIRKKAILRFNMDNSVSLGHRRVNFLSFIGSNLLFATPFILIGTIVHIFFYPYLLEAFKTWFYGTPFGYGIAKTIARANLFNIFFLTGLSTVDFLMNPVKLAALFIIFKFKGIAIYYFYYLLWASVLALSLFIY